MRRPCAASQAIFDSARAAAARASIVHLDRSLFVALPFDDPPPAPFLRTPELDTHEDVDRAATDEEVRLALREIYFGQMCPCGEWKASRFPLCEGCQTLVSRNGMRDLIQDCIFGFRHATGIHDFRTYDILIDVHYNLRRDQLSGFRKMRMVHE